MVLYVASVMTKGIALLVTISPNLLIFHGFIDGKLLDQDLEVALKNKPSHQRLFKGRSYLVGKLCSYLA